MGGAAQWQRLARQWDLLASPLRPCAEDLAIYRAALEPWRARPRQHAARVVVLGATPELARLPWPAEVQALAADRSEVMIRALWPGPGAAVCCDWRCLPLAAGSCDVFIGDGCFTTHDFPAGYRALVDSLHRVLRADGRLLLRFFSRPHVNETADAIFADLDAGRIGSFHALKWRLVMSQHGSLEQGSRLPDVWRAWRERVSDHAALAERSGWPLAVIDTINAYRGVDSGYTFPTRAEIEVSLGTHFAIDGWWTPSYELGDRCPIVLFRPR